MSVDADEESYAGLTRDEVEIFSRQIALSDIGLEGQSKLKDARVCLVGVGGLGSPAAILLAAMGLGYLRLVDRDVVSRSDLHRQHLYDRSGLGYPKVEAAAKRLREVNPRIAIDPVPAAVTSFNANDLVKEVDVVIDGLDNIEARYLINRACVKQQTPYIFASAIEAYGNVSTIVPKETPCLECFYSGIKSELLDKCALVGVHPALLGIISSIEVWETVKLVTGGRPNLQGRLMIVDLRNFTFDAVEIKRREGCLVCGDKPDAAPLKVEEKTVEVACGRDGRAVFVITPPHNLRVNLEKVAENVAKRKRPIMLKSEAGLTFHESAKITVSVLSSGVAIVQVEPEDMKAIDEGTVMKIYESIVGPVAIGYDRVALFTTP